MQDKTVESNIIGRLGISEADYAKVRDNALKKHEDYMKRKELRYAFNEIGHAHSGPKKVDKRASSSESGVKIRAVISNKNSGSFNVLEEII